MEYKKNLVSVVIPTYQHGNVVVDTIQGVMKQSYKNLQVIVVNDGSTDNTVEMLAPYESEIKVIHQENKGANAARNRGFEEVEGEFVLFLDADVHMKVDMIERMVATLRKTPQASYTYSGFRFGWKRFKGLMFDEYQIKNKNFVHTSSLIRSKDFVGFDESIKRLQDWDLWLSMLREGKRGVLTPGVLFSVRIDGESRIGSSWLPSFVYGLPWKRFGWTPKRVEKYQSAKKIILEKHGL